MLPRWVQSNGGTGWWPQKRSFFVNTTHVLRDINIGPRIIRLSNAPKGLSNKTINTPKTPKDKQIYITRMGRMGI